MYKKFFFFYFLVFLNFVSQAQNSWSLEQCIDYALKNNYNLQQSELQVKQADVNLLQSKASLLPSLNASISNYYNFGKRIDLYTNKFADKKVRSDNYSLNGNVTLFNGLQQWNTIKQYNENLAAAKFDFEANQQTIILNIASAYLNVLYATEQLKVSQNQLALSIQQQERTQKLVDAGNSAKNVLLDVESQIATDELQIVNDQNTLNLAYLSLTLLLDLPSAEGFNITQPELPEPNINESLISAEAALAAANTTQPSIKAAESRIKSAYTGIEIAKGNLSPTLTLGGSIGSGFSGLSTTILSTTTMESVIGKTSSGESVIVQQDIPTVTQTTAYGSQLNSNLNKSFGFQLSIPIFNGYQVKSQISKAKINYENAKFNSSIAKRDLMRNVKQAYADAVAAVKKYKATQKSLSAFERSYQNYEIRYNVGAINVLDFNNAKNKLAKAHIDLLQAKYDYYFKLKVLEYYQGKPIGL